MGPDAIPCVFNKKRQAEEDYTCMEEKAVRRQSREKFEDFGLEDQSEAATSQGMLAATIRDLLYGKEYTWNLYGNYKL